MAELDVTLLRFHHSSGGSKDWALAWDAEAVQIYYGKTGSALRTVAIPRPACCGQSPAVEARARMDQKVREGYQVLGHYRLNLANRRTLTPVGATDAVPAAPAPPCLYWERRPRHPDGAQLSGNPSPALREAAVGIAATLRQVHCIREFQVQPSADNDWCLRLEWAEGAWSFGQGVTPAAGSGAYLDNDGCGRGVIPCTSPVPALLMLALARVDPDLVIADEAAAVVRQVPAFLQVEDRVLEALNLKPKTVQELLAAVPTATASGWFF